MRPSESQKSKRTVAQGHNGLVRVWVKPTTRDAINASKRGLDTQDDVISRWHDFALKAEGVKTEA